MEAGLSGVGSLYPKLFRRSDLKYLCIKPSIQIPLSRSTGFSLPFSLDYLEVQYRLEAFGQAPVSLLRRIAGKLRLSGGALEVSRRFNSV